MQDGIPFTSFAVEDVQAEYERLRSAGVVFTQLPVAMGPVTTAVLDDTCGNLIQLAQKSKRTLPLARTWVRSSEDFRVHPGVSSAASRCRQLLWPDSMTATC